MFRSLARFVHISCCLLLVTPVCADDPPQPAGPFQNHMVLQRSPRVPVWGTASPRHKITVEFGGQVVHTTANRDGRWHAELLDLDYGGPSRLTIRSDGGTVVINDVLVGEVWLCGGQSNMQWSVRQSGDAEKEIAVAKWPDIRFFSTPLHVSEEPAFDTEGAWARCDPQSAAHFSAVAYYFGRALHQRLGVPVGLICCAWGGTPAEAWTSRQTLGSDPKLSFILQRYRDHIQADQSALIAFREAMNQFEKLQQTTGVGELKADGLPPSSAYRQSRQMLFLNQALAQDAAAVPPYGPAHFQSPAGVYNGMIHPLAPFAIRGVIWYQGESNVSRPYEYRVLLPAMITDWRTIWNRDDLPFGIVQLAGVGPIQTKPVEKSQWADLRDVQRQVAEHTPHSGLIVTIDIGHPELVHPPNKQDVGLRLARWAMAEVYRSSTVYSGPLYQSMRTVNNKVHLRFSHIDGELTTMDVGPLQGFAIAGSDKRFHWADAEIRGDVVVVSSDHVPHPIAVRYGWAENPIGNLCNAAKLPASPFRTDDWTPDQALHE